MQRRQGIIRGDIGVVLAAWMAAKAARAAAPIVMRIALFLAAPFIGLAYVIALPFVGVGAIIYHAVRLVRN